MADDTPWFWLAFSLGTVIPDAQFGDTRFEQRTIGSVNLSSGRLVVCDALVGAESRPLDLRLVPGSYDVDIAIAHFPDDDQRIAAARIRLGAVEPAQWGIALREGCCDLHAELTLHRRGDRLLHVKIIRPRIFPS